MKAWGEYIYAQFLKSKNVEEMYYAVEFI
jgi:hypothetical protein